MMLRVSASSNKRGIGTRFDDGLKTIYLAGQQFIPCKRIKTQKGWRYFSANDGRIFDAVAFDKQPQGGKVHRNPVQFIQHQYWKMICQKSQIKQT